MKKILQSVFMIAVTVLAMSQATGAYFSSNVTAANNEIATGTLMFGFVSTGVHTDASPWGFPNAYWVAYDDAGNPGVSVNPLETWTNAAPGLPVAYAAEAGADTWEPGNYSFWVAAVNRGSLPLKYNANVANGEWTNLPRVGTLSCTSVSGTPGSYVGANNNLVSVQNVYRYDVGVGTGCENHEECRNIRDNLAPFGFVPKAGVGTDAADAAQLLAQSGVYYGSSDGSAAGTEIELQPNEFVVYRVDVNLSETADNCYQDATYQYDLVGSANQVNDPIW